MAPTPVFATESEDSAVNTEDIEPVVLLRRARVFDGVGMLMRKAGRKISMAMREPSERAEVYIGCHMSGLYEAVLWVRYLLWRDVVVGYAKHAHIAQLVYHIEKQHLER